MVQKLYRTEEGTQLQQVNSSKDEPEEKDNPMLIEGEWSCFMKRVVKFECCICSCLRPKAKRYRLLKKGRKDLAVETDIVNLLKQLRAIWTILDMKLYLSNKEMDKIKEEQRHTIKLLSDPEDSQVDVEANFLRKITLRGNYDLSKFSAGEVTQREVYANLSPQPRRKSLKSIQRNLVSSVQDEPSAVGFYLYKPDPKERKTLPQKRNTQTSFLPPISKHNTET